MRIENFERAVAANPELRETINWFSTRTPLGRLSHLEIFEAFQDAEAAGYVITKKAGATVAASQSGGANG